MEGGEGRGRRLNSDVFTDAVAGDATITVAIVTRPSDELCLTREVLLGSHWLLGQLLCLLLHSTGDFLCLELGKITIS